MSACVRGVWAAAVCVAIGLPGAAAAQMPDARRMSGIPMPASDVPAGTVSVRLVRGELTNDIVGHQVELHLGARVETAKTDQSGRAVFSGVQPGIALHAAADVDGEHLESQSFEVPAAGGIRLVLVAGAGASPDSGAAAQMPGTGGGPAVMPPVAPGDVVFAGESRIQIEFEDDTLEVFYLFDLVNPSSAPVNPRTELTFELPKGAEQAATLEGSSTQATVRGRVVAIAGPIAPGTTPVRVAFSLAPAGPERTIIQRLPAAWTRVQVMMTGAGGARLASPQFAATREMAGEGQPFLLGTGGALPANQELALALSGLPARSHWGRYVSLALAALVLLVGAYVAASGQDVSGAASRMAALAERRDRLMADLVRLEEQHRAGAVDGNRYAVRHAELVDQLERVYGELDRQPGAADLG